MPSIMDISVSVVAYETDPAELSTLLASFSGSELRIQVTVVDNSATCALREVVSRHGARYIKTERNLGFGSGHNLVLREMLPRAKYHLVVNPDILLSPAVLQRLVFFMENNPSVGQVMPRILYPGGKEQRLCKLLPSPIDLLGRRFLGALGDVLLAKQKARYELRDADLSMVSRVPNLSGCFMFLRGSVLEQSGLFDERFFLYMEDVDLCRRIGACSWTVFLPEVSVTHGYAKGSYRQRRLLRYHIESAVRYFNKWSWWNDAVRRELNEHVTPLGVQGPLSE